MRRIFTDAAVSVVRQSGCVLRIPTSLAKRLNGTRSFWGQTVCGAGLKEPRISLHCTMAPPDEYD